MTEWIDLTRHPVLPRLVEAQTIFQGKVFDVARRLKENGIQFQSIIELEVIDNSSFAGSNDITKVTYLEIVED
jgi:hypothetical protein